MNPLLRQSEVNQYKDKAVKAAMAIDSRAVFKMAAYPLVRRGNQTFTSCPECGCQPKERKCSIGPTGKWYCFGCALGGGAPQAYNGSDSTFIQIPHLLFQNMINALLDNRNHMLVCQFVYDILT